MRNNIRIRHPLLTWPLLLLLGLHCHSTHPATTPKKETRVITGAERTDVLFPLLRGKNVALVVNHTAVVGQTHLVDTLLQAGITVKRIFAPEHGFRGAAEAGETVKDGRDAKTGLPILSLYGKKKKPEASDLADVDIVVFDIQDVGARFYTYISTLFYVLEACAEQDKMVLVLDRPNPNGHYVDGPVLDPALHSFVGIAPLPIVHGCTMAELAEMFKGESWIKSARNLRLSKIICQNYNHHTPYILPIKPSPNLPDMRAVLLYPSICLFEGTTASLGRGTETPFQMIGHPDFPNQSFAFTPRSVAAAVTPPQQDKVCFGLDFRNEPIARLQQQKQLDLSVLLNFYQQFPKDKPFFLANNFFDKLAGTPLLRQQILEGVSESSIRASWAPGLTAYKTIRKKYLLYPE